MASSMVWMSAPSDPEGWAPIMSFGGNIGLQWKGIDLNIDLSGGAMQGWRQNYELANAYHGNGNSPVYLLEDRWHRADLYDPDSEWIPGRYPAIRIGEFSYNNKNSDFWLHNVRYLRIKNREAGCGYYFHPGLPDNYEFLLPTGIVR